jgi:hypothetical protein
MDSSHPLTPDHLLLIKDALTKLQEADMMVTKAKNAGIDVGEQSKQISDLRTRLRQIGIAYFPGKL